MTSHRVRFEGPAVLALNVVTALADAESVDLISSDQPDIIGEGRVTLNVTVEGAFDAVADAVTAIRGGMPAGASLEIIGG